MHGKLLRVTDSGNRDVGVKGFTVAPRTGFLHTRQLIAERDIEIENKVFSPVPECTDAIRTDRKRRMTRCNLR